MEHNHSGNTIDKRKQSKIYIALTITILFGMVEFVTGNIFNSLALIADAGHMITDGIALFIAAIATFFASRPATEKHTYGLSKMEITAAILNLLLIFYVVIDIGIETYSRFSNDVIIHGSGVIGIAVIGLLVNIAVFFLLHNGLQTLNTKAAKMHVIGDMIGSVAAIFSGAMIYFFNLTIFDPLMSAIVCFILIKMALSLLKEVTNVILDAVPEGLCLTTIENSITDIRSVVNIHDLHVWKCTDTDISLTAHIDVDSLDDWNNVLHEINAMLLSKYNIEHITLQPELLK